MAGQSYIGKIAGIVTLNTRDVTRGVNSARDELSGLGRSIQGIISSANQRAGRSFDAIFTPIQKLKQALQAARFDTLNFPRETIDRANTFARAVESLFVPLKKANDAFQTLGAGAQEGLQTQLNKALQTVSFLAQEVDRFGSTSETRFAAAVQRVNDLTQAVQRVKDADESVLATQRANLAFANSRIQVLQKESQLISAQGASTDIRQRLAAQVEIINRTQQEAAFRERNVELAERELRAIQAMSEAQNRFINAEFRRREGVPQRRNADAFDDSAASIRNFSRAADQQFIGVQERSVESLTARVRELNVEFQRLPTEVQRELSGMASRLNEVANGAQRGTVGIGLYEDAVNRMAASVRRASSAIDDEIDVLIRREQAARDIYAEQMRQADRAAAAELAMLTRRERAARDAEAERLARPQREADAEIAALIRREQAQQRAARAIEQSNAAVVAGARNLGDINTRAFGRQQLAFQQFLFAIDDAASVTGGLEQRIRAAGNNITQLGVISGSTTGLVVALAATLSAQAAVALVKFANSGTEAADRMKALNDAMAKQRDTAEQLAEAIRDIGDALSNGLFSKQAAASREFAKRLDEIAKKQKELRDQRESGLSETVVKERSIQGSLDKQIEGETDIGRRVALQSLKAESQRREREELARLSAQGPVQPADVARALRATVRAPTTGTRRFFNDRLREIDAEVQQAGGDPERLAALIRRAKANEESLALKNSLNQVQSPQSRLNVAEFERLLGRIDSAGRQRRIDEDTTRSLGLLRDPSNALTRAQESLADAIAEGVPSAVAIGKKIDELGLSFDNIISRIEKQEGGVSRDAIEVARRSFEAAKNAADVLEQIKFDAFRAADEQERLTERQQGAIERDQRITAGLQALNPLSGQFDEIRNLNAVRDRARLVGDNNLLAKVEKATGEALNGIFRGLAPTLFGLQDQVQNAILQGPSRAALNATDVSTLEGSRELTRLLRGDDAARNQDMLAIAKEQLKVQQAIEEKLRLENAN